MASHCSWQTITCSSAEDTMRAAFPASVWGWLPVPSKGKLAVIFKELRELPRKTANESVTVQLDLPVTDMVSRTYRDASHIHTDIPRGAPALRWLTLALRCQQQS